MLVINGRIFVDVKIDQRSLDNAPNVFGTLTLTESVAGLFPAAMLVLNDYSGQLGKTLALTEGNEILVTVGKSANDLNTVTRQYRLYSLKQQMTAFGPQMKVACVYDAPNFISESANEHYVGTSSQVMQQIADKCKLYYCGPEKYNGRSPHDSQNWWNINRSRAMFVQQGVARHGYIDSHSAMCSSVTSLGELRYRNLMDVIEKPLDQIPFLFAHSSPLAQEDKKRRTYLVDEAHAHSDAGLMNSWQNYGSTRVTHSRSGVASVDTSVDVKTSGTYLAINDQVSKTVSRARYDYSPLDCGNVNEKYDRGFYQNVKQLGLFSERVSVLCSEPTAVQIFDPVLYRQSVDDLASTSSVSDIYIVIGKTIYIKGGVYYAERIELVRMSLTEKGESALKCAVNPDQASKNALPESRIDPTAMRSQTSLGVTGTQLGFAKDIQTKASATDKLAKATKTDSLKVAKSVVNIARSAMKIANLVSGGVAGIKSDPAGALSTLTGATGSLLQYNTAVGGFSSGYMKTGVSALTYANDRLNDPKFNSAVRVAALTKPGGLAQNQSAIAGAVALNKQTNEIFNNGYSVANNAESIYALHSQPGGKQALDTFNSRIDEMNQNTQNINKGMTDTWNASLSLATGNPVPSLAPAKDSSGSLYSFVGGSLSQPTGYEAKVKSPSDVTSEYTATLLKKNEDGSLPWGNLSAYSAYSNNVPIARADPQVSGRLDWASLSAPQTPTDVTKSATTLETNANLYQSQQAQSYA